LHDIGKVAIRDSILLKPGKLTPEEFDEMKMHTLFGEEVIANLEQMAGQPTSFLSCAKQIAGSHHEKFDGSGYPRGVKGDEISAMGQILMLAEVIATLSDKTWATHGPQRLSMMLKMNRRRFSPVLIDHIAGLLAGETRAGNDPGEAVSADAVVAQLDQLAEVFRLACGVSFLFAENPAGGGIPSH